MFSMYTVLPGSFHFYYIDNKHPGFLSSFGSEGCSFWLFQLNLKFKSNMQFYWLFARSFYTHFHQELFILKPYFSSTFCLKTGQYVIPNEVISQETNKTSLRCSLNPGDGLKMENVTDRWWGWNHSVCLFLLSSLTVNNLVPDWLIPMYHSRMFFLYWWLFPTILGLSGLFYSWFSFIERLFVSDFSLPTFHILTHRELNWPLVFPFCLIKKTNFQPVVWWPF